MDTKKILIVDDHPAFRYGLAYLLNDEDDLEVAAQAGGVHEALGLAEQDPPDLALSDLTLPDGNGLEFVKQLKTLHPKLPVLVISMHDELVYAERALRAGARGYLMKENSDQLVRAVRQILGGGVYVSEAVTNHFLNSLTSGQQQTFSFPLSRLTDRELEVFEAIGQGKATEEVATQLGISARTVDAHRSHIRNKLGLTDSAELLRYAIRWIESGAVENGAGR